MRSSKILSGIDNGFSRSLYKSMGFSNDDLERPIIGIANSWNNISPGHFNLNQLSEQVKKGIYRSGGTAVEFGVIGACDGIAQGHKGMHYILPSREVICSSIEIMVEAHQLDAIVLLASCDKVVPGMLMAAARLDIPAILVNGGPMAGGVVFDERKSDSTSMSEALGMYRAGKITKEKCLLLEDLVCPSCGSCAFLGTANTMGCLSEALGMSLPGAGLIPATHSDRLRIAYESGIAIVNLTKNNITAKQIINKESVENAVKVCLGISGSTNAVLHLTAIAYEAGLNMNVLEDFDEFSQKTPQVAKVNPAAKWDMEDFWMAGGIPRVIERMMPLLNKDVLTCTGKTLEENVKNYQYKFPENNEIIKTLENPFGFLGGIAVLKGNLAPKTGVSKPGAIDPSVYKFSGKAIVFDSEEEAEKAILNGEVKPGHVVVIRYEGPKGGPGMREMFKAMKYLYGMGLTKNIALVTDGRFSGTNNGCFVGHVSPEAAEGGPIAIVEDGDLITIDVNNRRLEIDLSDEEIKERLSKWQPPKPKFTKGYLSIYSKLASSAAEGAVVKLHANNQ
ncbi:dihydroxy-acid dehydratase [Clostridium sp. HV4-5-A1G]|uniref:dihydroxy-acid dehydratase n=1 Tax=Clostridium sp. HV4-5-A1G TaxID=2004595 RepID=UPI00123A1477|nr:dihydroxy-acid dehydratase [Clostridium sp. HV4-5-A1G]KAA8674089.1 dihydroxy-acid dehydratase [Clostridium sp. HV4-5-A1G]CAB1253668.1 Dihydroxy-acid dehydratase [Clostridiaceae bacterium BL-3]